MVTFQQMVGERIQIARNEAGLTQEMLSERLGFNDRQILSSIESGKRKITSDELVICSEQLAKPIDYFLDQSLIVGKDVVSWRKEVTNSDTTQFEVWSLALIGLQKSLAEKLGDTFSPLRSFLPLSKHSSYETAWSCAEMLVREWQLGDAPAKRLQSTIEEKLPVTVLMVDAPNEISGGAVNLDTSAAIFINRAHSRGRRNFTMAHELFHVLTWQTMPPKKYELEDDKSDKRVEQLANNFAGALLMPFNALKARYNLLLTTNNAESATSLGLEDYVRWFKDTALIFEVSAKALKYRLKNLKLICVAILDNEKLDFQEELNPAPPYGKKFLDCINRGIAKGVLSARKAMTSTRCTFEELDKLIKHYGLMPSFAS